MPTSTIPHPGIVSRNQWLAKRKKLLAHEKTLPSNATALMLDDAGFPWSNWP